MSCWQHPLAWHPARRPLCCPGYADTRRRRTTLRLASQSAGLGLLAFLVLMSEGAALD
jgi:hypothetical protein